MGRRVPDLDLCTANGPQRVFSLLHGARPVLILTPTLKEKENFTALPEGVPVLRFQDPNAFPQLFDPAHCYDNEHLNHAGAQIFTDLLAADEVSGTTPPHSRGDDPLW